jgi:hypothetical protein
MSMERSYDWKAPVALVLAGLALFVALGGTNMFNFLSAGPPNAVVYVGEARLIPAEGIPRAEAPQVVPVHPEAMPVVPAVPNMPEWRFFEPRDPIGYTYDGPPWGFWHEWRAWFSQMPSIMPVLVALALVFIGWRLLSQGRNRPAPSPQAPVPPTYANPNPAPGAGPSAPPPPGPPYYGDINQRQTDS